MAAITSIIAAVGVGAAVYGASQQSKAIKKASQAQQQSADQQIQLQREQMARAFEVMQKYGVQGDWARNQMAAFLGAPQTGAGANPGAKPTASGTPPAGVTVPRGLASPGNGGGSIAAWDGNPALRAQYGGDRDAYFAGEPAALTGEGSALSPMMIGGPGQPLDAAMDPANDLKTPDQLREEAWDNYTKTPFATIARRNAGKATEDFTSMAGAQGSTLSGRTARGMAEVANEMEQDGFGSYWSALSGMNEMGFNADSASVGAGQTYADRAGQASSRSADAQAEAAVGQANAWNSALGDVAGWAGWAAGNGGSGSTGAQKVITTPGMPGNKTTPMKSNGRRAAIA